VLQKGEQLASVRAIEGRGEEMVPGEKGYLKVRVSLDLTREGIIHPKPGAEPCNRFRGEQRRRRHGKELTVKDDKISRRSLALGLDQQSRERESDVVPLRMIGVEEEFLVKRGNQDHICVDARLKTFQGRKRRRPVVVRPGKCFLKSVITRNNRGRASDLLVSLLNQSDEDPSSGPET
jgi:hypothetical protein